MKPDRSSRLWGGLISFWICVQLFTLDILTRLAVKQMLRSLAVLPAPWSQALHIAVDMILLICLWVYYDSIDDRGFADFCKSDNRKPLWDIPAHGAGLTVAAAIAAPILCFPLYDLLTTLRLPRVAAAWIAPAVAVGFTVGARLGLLARRRNTWAVQKELVNGREKKIHPAIRVLYALVFFGALGLAVWVAIGVVGFQVIRIGGALLDIPPKLCVGGAAVALLCHAVYLLYRIRSRRRFLSRLERLSREGHVTYTVEGHPYLSLISPLLYVGLTVTHRIKRGNLNQQTAYRVGLINGKSRRRILILCGNQVYRFLHRLPNQRLIRRRGVRGSTFYRPMYSWFESHAFDFPDGQGTRLLLIDPFPATVAMEDGQTDWFSELDVGDHAFGYTVYSPHSFLNFLERTARGESAS